MILVLIGIPAAQSIQPCMWGGRTYVRRAGLRTYVRGLRYAERTRIIGQKTQTRVDGGVWNGIRQRPLAMTSSRSLSYRHVPKACY